MADFGDTYVPKCWVDLSYNSRIVLDFFLFWIWIEIKNKLLYENSYIFSRKRITQLRGNSTQLNTWANNCHPSPDIQWQVEILSECLHARLHICLLAMASVGGPYWLDGPERHQYAFGLHGPRGHLDKSLPTGHVLCNIINIVWAQILFDY